MKLIRAKATVVLIGLCGVAMIGVGAANGKGAVAEKPQESAGPCIIVNNPAPDHVTTNFTVLSYMDDIVVPDGGCTFNTFTIRGAWATMEPGAGTGVTLFIHGDNAGEPVSIPFAAATVTSYSEVATGNFYVGRPESEVTITFDDLFLDEGPQWINVNVDGPEKFFPALGCDQRQGSTAWGFTEFFLLPAPILFFAVDPCDAFSDLSWTMSFE